MDIERFTSELKIREVLTRYARAADRQDFDLIESCYHPDAQDDHGRYKGELTGLMAYLRELAPNLRNTFHMMSEPNINIRGTRAWCETYTFYHRDMAGHPPVYQGLRYLDYFEERDGEWRIARRMVVLDWEHAAGPEPSTPSGPEWLRGAQGSDDPAVAFFAEMEGHP